MPTETTPTERLIMKPLDDYRSREAASFVAQIDDQTSLLSADLAGITPAELEWQPAPGMNTIGMLLAHIAVVELFWTQFGLEGKADDGYQSILGIDGDDDGMPMPAGAHPPAVLAGRDLAFHLDLVGRARTYLKQVASRLGDEDMEVERSRRKKSGVVETYNVRWVLYHILEHQSGHYGQILLLRHQYRDLT